MHKMREANQYQLVKRCWTEHSSLYKCTLILNDIEMNMHCRLISTFLPIITANAYNGYATLVQNHFRKSIKDNVWVIRNIKHTAQYQHVRKMPQLQYIIFILLIYIRKLVNSALYNTRMVLLSNTKHAVHHYTLQSCHISSWHNRAITAAKIEQ